MHQRKLGPFNVSAIGLGCMNISMGYGPRPDDEESGNLFNLALDNGYTMLDTAAMYGMGHSENVIGKYLSHRRSDYTLASKCGIFRNEEDKAETNCRPEVLLRTCEDSLKRLNTDVIDLYYLHRVDTKVPVEESIGAISRMVEQGKVQTIGVSEISDENLRKAHATHPLTAVQSEYSLWTRTPERKVLSTCEELGISFVPFSPLARQFLTGKCTDLTHFDDNDIRCTNARPRFEPENFAINNKLLKPYGEIAERVGCSMAQLALAWLLARGDNIIPIPGTKHVDYMIENAGAGDIVLDQETVDELDQLINENTVAGDRYQANLMNNIDSEKD
jgi:aryl-alcohol dehydrogenase-like predicted oxidoreductase